MSAKAFGAAEASINTKLLQASISRTRMSPGFILFDQIPPSTSKMVKAIPGMFPISSDKEISAFDPKRIRVDFSSSNIPAGLTSFGHFVPQQLPQVGPIFSTVTSTNVGTPVASHFQVTGNKIQNNLQKAGKLVPENPSSQVTNQPFSSKAFAAEEAKNVLQASLSKTKMSPGVILLDQIPPSIATMTESIPGMAPVSSENEIPAFDPNAIWVDFSSSNLLADQPPFGSFVKQLPLVKSPRPNFSESSSVGFGFNMQPPFALSQPTTTPAAPSAISMQQLQRQVIKNTKALLRRLSVSRRLQFMRTIQTLSPQQKKLFFTKIAQLSIGN